MNIFKIFQPNIYKLENKKDIKGLINALKYKNGNMFYNVRPILVSFGDSAVEPCISALKNRNSRVRNYSAQVLGEICSLRAVEPLINSLKDKDVSVRESVTRALGRIHDTRAIDPLLKQINSTDRNVKKATIWALGNIGDVRVFDVILRSLDDNDSVIREAAVIALGNLGDKRATEYLLLLISDKKLKKRVAIALGQLGDMRGIEPLIDVLDTNYANEGYELAVLLAKYGDIALEPLIAILQKGTLYQKEHAIQALGQMGNIRAVEPICDLLKNRATELGLLEEKAVNALTRIGDTSAVIPLIEYLKSSQFIPTYNAHGLLAASYWLGELEKSNSTDSQIKGIIVANRWIVNNPLQFRRQSAN